MFRYCLQPWNHEVRLQELLEYCRRNDIDSVMLFTQSHDLHEKMPTFEEAREFLHLAAGEEPATAA